jgi:hypothetical protein
MSFMFYTFNFLTSSAGGKITKKCLYRKNADFFELLFTIFAYFTVDDRKTDWLYDIDWT